MYPLRQDEALFNVLVWVSIHTEDALPCPSASFSRNSIHGTLPKQAGPYTVAMYAVP